jgi:hypothetical protein
MAKTILFSRFSRITSEVIGSHLLLSAAWHNQQVGRLITTGSFFLKKPATVQFFSELKAGLEASVQINPGRAFVEEKN